MCSGNATTESFLAPKRGATGAALLCQVESHKSECFAYVVKQVETLRARVKEIEEHYNDVRGQCDMERAERVCIEIKNKNLRFENEKLNQKLRDNNQKPRE